MSSGTRSPSLLRPKTSQASSASPSWRHNAIQSSIDTSDSINITLEGTGHSGPCLNRRSHSASSRLVTALSSSPQTVSAFTPSLASPIGSPSVPLSSFSRPQSSMSSHSVKLRPQIGSTHIDAEALLQSSAYHGVPISKRFIPNDALTQSLQPIMFPKSGKSHDVYVRSGDSVVMLDEENVRFSSFVNSVEVTLAQLPPRSQSSMKDRIVMACNTIEKLCFFQTPAQRLIKLIKDDIFRGIWQDYQPPAAHLPEHFESRRGYFEDCLGVAGVMQSLTEETNEALAQAAALRASCKQKEQRISELEAVVSSLKEENTVFKEKEGGFQEIFARSLVRMRSDQAKRIEAEKELRDMQLKEAAFIHLAENEREDSRQRVNAIQATVQQMEQAYVDGERKLQELQHVMDSMFSRIAYTNLYRNHEKKKILLSRLEAQLRFKLMMPESAVTNDIRSLAGPPLIKVDKLKKVVAALAPTVKQNAAAGSNFSSAAQEAFSSTKFFCGLGDGRDLPRYLRSGSPVLYQPLQIQETHSLIKQFWSQVDGVSVASSGGGIHEFLNMFFGKMVNGIDVISLAYSLIAAAHKYSKDDVLIEYFWKTWCGEFSEDVFIHQYRMVENLKHYFVSNHNDGNCKISIDIFEKSLLAHFPQKTSIEIANLMNCVQSFGACTVAGKDVDISCLFDDRDGVCSPFAQLLWLQGLHERTTFLRLLQDAVFKIEPMAALKVKCRHIRSAFLSIDPNRPLAILEENLRFGFGMPPGCPVIGEDVISFDDFVLLFSTGSMRLFSNLGNTSSKNEIMSEK